MSQPLNLMDPAVRANPYPLYAELRRRPVQQVEPGGMWAISRYDDILAAFKDPQLSTSAYLPMFQPPWLGTNPFADTLLSMTPPRHTTMRNLVSNVFTAAGLTRMEARLQIISDMLAEQIVRRREVDLVLEWSMALPAHVIGGMLGLPPHMHPRIKQWADLMTSIPTFQNPSPEQSARVKSDLALMQRLILEAIEERRRRPADDMISDLVQAKVDGQALTNDEIVSFSGLLMVAGLETTTHLLANSMLILSERRDLFEQVKAERGRLIPQFIEEVLRFESPAQAAFRWTIGPTEIDGVKVPAGAMVALLLGSATRDEKHFPDPDVFRLDRGGQTQIPFGHGIHYCLGAVLTRLEARFGLEALLSRITGLTREPGEVPWVQAFNVRGPTRLMALLTPK